MSDIHPQTPSGQMEAGGGCGRWDNQAQKPARL